VSTRDGDDDGYGGDGETEGEDAISSTSLGLDSGDSRRSNNNRSV
jgi:hypothetical protein